LLAALVLGYVASALLLARRRERRAVWGGYAVLVALALGVACACVLVVHKFFTVYEVWDVATRADPGLWIRTAILSVGAAGVVIGAMPRGRAIGGWYFDRLIALGTVFLTVFATALNLRYVERRYLPPTDGWWKIAAICAGVSVFYLAARETIRSFRHFRREEAREP
jgi:hypothetical protein